MNIAITGSTGFIGSALLKLLENEKSYSISLFDRKRHSFENIDSLNEFVYGMDVVIHLAGETENEEFFYSTNTLATKQLLDAIRLFGKKNAHFILASSFAVYEVQKTKIKLSEKKTNTIPRNHYGMSKLFAEELTAFYNRNYHIQTSILRIANIYGPRKTNKHEMLIDRIVHAIDNDKPLKINGDGTQSRDFIYVDDVADAICKAVQDKNPSLVVNICTGKEISVLSVVNKIEKLLGKKVILQFNENNIEKGYWIGNPKKAKEKLGFLATTDIDKGLEQTIKGYLKNKNL